MLRIQSSLLLVLVLTVLTAGCSPRTGPRRETRFLLGTTCTVQIHDSAYPEDLFDRVFARVREIQYRMTIIEDDSEVIRVNRAAGDRPIAVSADTFEVIESGLEYSRLSDGAFDITIGPLVKLWGIGSERARVPSDQELERTIPLVRHEDLVLYPDSREVFLTREGMELDLGGIAKGYAADEAVRIMIEAGVEHGLVDFGGDIRVINTRPDGNAWRIGIQDPVNVDRGSYLGIIELEQISVVTSGDYERFLETDGTVYHHIIDRTTGYLFCSGVRSVTAVSETAMVADAVSTAVFVMGLERGKRFFDEAQGIEGIIVTDTNMVYVSPGLSDFFTLRENGYRLAEW